MVFTMIRDIIDIELLEDDDGVAYESEKIIRKDVRVPIYINLEEISLVMPHFNDVGRMYNKRTIVKVNGDSIILNHTFDYIAKLKSNKNKIKGFI